MEGLENNLDAGNAPEKNSQDREEVLRLRKERREAEKAEKERLLNQDIKYVIVPLGFALEDRGFDFQAAGLDAKSKIEAKIRHYFQKTSETDLDVNTLADAIVESPDCIHDENCGIRGLLDGHERRILMRIAENRKQKSEQDGDEQMNPYEALFETESGEYYMARLLNMPHLKEESEFMENCVGTSSSYLNRIKRGDIEILSFRHTPKFNKETQKLEIDEPILTIEYDLKTKTINQIKGYDDEYLTGEEYYFPDVLEALRKLKETETDKGEKRDVKHISKHELEDIVIDDFEVLTYKGLVHLEDYDEKEHGIILKKGKMPITKDTPKFFAAQLFNFVEGTKLQESEIAYDREEISENTKLYIGQLYPNIFKELPETIEHVYTKFPEHEVYIRTITIPETPKTAVEYEAKLKEGQFRISDSVKDILSKADLTQGSGKTYKLIIPTTASLGFNFRATRQEIQERVRELGIGKNLLPAVIGPELRLKIKSQKLNGWILIDMEPISGRDGVPSVFSIRQDYNEPWLVARDGRPESRWETERRWAFSAE